jgi:hypothetical protein
MNHGREVNGGPNFKIISESDRGYIGKCSCCDQYNFVYNNLILVFNKVEMINFLDWLQQYRFSRDTHMTLYNGRNRIYSSPQTNLFFAFNESELEELQLMTAEVKLLVEVSDILK